MQFLYLEDGIAYAVEDEKYFVMTGCVVQGRSYISDTQDEVPPSISNLIGEIAGEVTQVQRRIINATVDLFRPRAQRTTPPDAEQLVRRKAEHEEKTYKWGKPDTLLNPNHPLIQQLERNFRLKNQIPHGIPLSHQETAYMEIDIIGRLINEMRLYYPPLEQDAQPQETEQQKTA